MARPGRKPVLTLDDDADANLTHKKKYHNLKPSEVNLQIRKVEKSSVDTFIAIRQKLAKGNPETFGEIVSIAANHLNIQCKQPVKTQAPSLSILE